MPIIEWLIKEHRPDFGLQGQVATGLSTVDRSLASRIPAALASCPCDMLFIHRDAEGESIELRLCEIEDAAQVHNADYVPIVPVRMTEAWLFSDEAAIRSAAENLRGNMTLNLPAKKTWERLADPKGVLFETLVIASGKQGRALAKFNPHRQRRLVTQRTHDFSGLRGLPSFDEFESQLLRKLRDF
ncbi:hypothetical protein [Duganella sp. HH101]|uniref:hypothetical protein n=1 Tax=Duganella sp. HH101 TaxID=1781066 RepID=UPI00114D17ED|nr:hypothetical protein [Duganella sp. HH101]